MIDLEQSGATEPFLCILHISAVWNVRFNEMQTFTQEELQTMDGTYGGVPGTINANLYGLMMEYNCEMVRMENVKPVDIVVHTPAPTV